jgi:hypothetical protein
MLERHLGTVLALGVTTLVAAGAVIGPHATDNYGLTHNSLVDLLEQAGRARLGGGLRLLGLLAGLGVVVLGHHRLPPSIGRSFFVLGATVATACFTLGVLARLALVDPRVTTDAENATTLIDALARLADSAGLLAAGLAVVALAGAVGARRATADPVVVGGYRLAGAALAVCGFAAGMPFGAEEASSVFRPGGPLTVAGSITLVVVVLAFGFELDRPGRPEPDPPPRDVSARSRSRRTATRTVRRVARPEEPGGALSDA